MNKSMRVLFVDDSQLDIELGCRQLDRENLEFEWQAAASASELRRALEVFRPDVVLSDFSMPGFSGLEALGIMREAAPDIPLIFVSGTIGEEMAVQCLREGATDYILKANLNRLGSSVRRAYEESVQRSRAREVELVRARLADIIEATPDVVATSDPEGKVTYINEAGCRLLGLSAAAIIGRPAADFYTEGGREILLGEAIPAALKEGAWQGETALVTQDGAEIPVSQVIVSHKTAGGEAHFLSAIARDVRERKTFEARLYHLAHHDPLTGLPNRSMLADRVAQALVHTRRSGRSVVLLALHLDNFGLINEGFGHTAGDRLLEEAGLRLRVAVRDGDTVARTGADEFAVLLADLARPDDAHAVARKIIDAMQLPLKIASGEARMTVSIGASAFPSDGEDFDTLFRNATTAMRRVAAEDRGGFQYYAAEMTRESLDRIDIETRLQAALQHRELALHYQPQYDIRGGRLVGVEALMRWFSRDGQTIPPVRFIPVAEETGLIRELGEWALAEACSAVLGWSAAGRPPVRVAVNVSPRQLKGAGFIDAVARVLDSTGFPPKLLELEITESALLGSGGAPTQALDELKALAVNIAIDDFGTGFSNLSYLSQLPIDRLKVDRTFVNGMTQDGRNAAIVQTIVALGHGLGLGVVAEGVETRAQLAMLADIGCDEAQGYLFAKPASGEQVRALLDLPARTDGGD